jgi:capsular exopolysaccharide synthesis family protein
MIYGVPRSNATTPLYGETNGARSEHDPVRPAARTKSDLSVALRVLRRGWLPLVLCFVVGGGAALAYSLSRPKLYTASASLWFRDPGFDQKLFGSSYLPPSTDPTTAQNTNVDLSSLTAVAQRTANALGGRASQSLVQSELKAVPEGASSIVQLVATDRDPRMAAAIATTAGRELVAFRKESDQATIERALKQVQSDEGTTSAQLTGAQSSQLRHLAAQLQVLASLQTGNVELIQAASVPSSPSSPTVTRNTAAGLVVGLLIGILAVFTRARLDQRIKDRDDLEELTDLPILAEIPRQPVSHGTDGVKTIPRAQFEAFGLLRANLRYLSVSRDMTSILVTSATPGEGKSTVASGLACAAAGAGVKVLLIEADLRRPSLRNQLSVPDPGSGLSEVITGQARLQDGIVPAHLRAEGALSDITVDVMLSGALPPNPGMLLQSHEMTVLLSWCSDQYDLVVIDTPPVSVVSDAIPLLSQVDSVLVVSSYKTSRRDATSVLFDQLYRLGAPLAGLVANRSRRASGNYEYYHVQTDPTSESVEA